MSIRGQISKMSEPKGELMRYGEMRDWLHEDYGTSEREVRALMAAGQIKGSPLRNNGIRKFYRKSQILRDVLRYEQSVTKKP